MSLELTFENVCLLRSILERERYKFSEHSQTLLYKFTIGLTFEYSKFVAVDPGEGGRERETERRIDHIAKFLTYHFL